MIIFSGGESRAKAWSRLPILPRAETILTRWPSAGEYPDSTRESATCLWLRPPWLLKAKDPDLFDREYRKQLESLVPKQVAEDLGPNAVILCWESFNVRCHRRLVAEWLEEKLGIVVPEVEHERSESLPFSQQPSKWNTKSSEDSQSRTLL